MKTSPTHTRPFHLQLLDPLSPDAGISAILPAYNEQESIAEAVNELVAALVALGRPFELIVVDDGSNDRTAEIVHELRRHEDRICLMRLPENRGYGAALRAGFDLARYPLVFHTDSDRQFIAAEITRLLALIETADIVCGYRIDRQDPPHRRFLAWGYNCMVRMLFAVPVRDTDCAFKLYRRSALRRVAIQSNRYFVSAEVLAKLSFLGHCIAEVGVTHRARIAGSSKVRLGCIVETLREAARVFWRPRFAELPALVLPPATRPAAEQNALAEAA